MTGIIKYAPVMVSRLGVGFETRLETHSPSLGLKGYRSRSLAYCLETFKYCNDKA